MKTVVLVEPSGPLNLGSVARLCENFGINQLRLVSPKCNPNDLEAKKMAVKGIKILESAKNYSSLIDAISDCQRVVATCGRIDHGDIPLEKSENALPWLINSENSQSPIALVFGREDRGLTNQELLLANKVLTLQTNQSYPSLNLSHAVAIVLHELHNFEQRKCQNEINLDHPKSSPASVEELGNFLIDAESLLLEVGFLLEHTAQARMAKIKGLLHRAEIRPEEVSLLRGTLRQLRWAISNKDS